jgi:DNA-methyltransferase (dcm)
MNQLTHLSLFSGIGGLDRAAEMSGFTTVGQCEFAEYPYKVLCKHWPDVPKWRDIRTLTGSDFYERTGLRTVDVISGGFPCQPFSVAGKRMGKEDDRFLWPEMLRVIKEIRPTWFIGENVAGLVSMAEPVGDTKMESRAVSRNADEDYYDAVSVQQEHMLLDGILEDVENAGYEVQPFIIPACGVGAPHRRERLFIVGRRNRDSEAYSPDPTLENTGCVGCIESKNVHQQQRRAESVRASEIMADAEYKQFDGGGATRGRRDGSANSGSDVPNPDKVRCDMREFGGKRVQRKNPPRYETDTGCENVSYTDNATPTRHRGNSREVHEQSESERFDLCCGTEWWAAEPDVGRGYDGISEWLDGIGGLSDGAKARGKEILRNLWPDYVQEAIQWTAGRFQGISTAQILLTLLCEYEESSNRSGIALEGREIAERLLRDLWRTVELAGTPHRRKYRSQLSREYSDALLQLPYDTSSIMPQAWANGAWEDGIGRVANGVKNRVDRLKCLGNAVVRQQAYPIFKAISDIERSAR